MGKGFTAPSDRFNIGVVGLGAQSGGLIERMSKISDARIIAGCDIHQKRLNTFRKLIDNEYEIKRNLEEDKEFEKLLNEDFKDRKLKENQIIKATVTEITKNFVVVDCKAKMEGMIPIEEFKNDEEF